MCGIVGFVSNHPIVDRAWLTVGRDALHHRGPDSAGIWWSPDRRVGLAHRRLAIIDLSPGGHQPMSDASGRLWVTFNGEIYNYLGLRREMEARGHSFRTSSDTEVILEAYRACRYGTIACWSSFGLKVGHTFWSESVEIKDEPETARYSL